MRELVSVPAGRDRIATDPAPVPPAFLKAATEEGAMEAATRTRPAAGALRIRLGRRGWLLLALGLLATGATLNWSWLAAIGLAPIILSLAPCALMCAAGFCLSGGSKSCATESASAARPDLTRD